MWKTFLRSFTVLLLILCSFSGDLYGQEEKRPPAEPWSFGVNGYYGTLFRYRRGLPPLNFTHPFGFELYATRHSIGKRRWERDFKNPFTGISLSYYNYGVPDELGEAVSLTGYIGNTLINFRNSSLRFNLGTGVVYSSRHYTPGVNELNMAIGSRYAFSLRGTLHYEIPLSEKTFLNLNLAFRHFSNGALNKPNNGMNFPLLGVGLRVQPVAVKVLQISDSAEAKPERSVRFNLRVGTGVKESLRIDTKHPLHNISFYVSKRFSRKSSLLLGVDGFYDSSVPVEYINQNLPVPEGDLDLRSAGITAGHELHIEKVSFVFMIGRYIHQPHKINPVFYQHYGLKYQACKNVSAGVMLMVHSKTAHVIQWGLGFHL